MSLMKLVRRVQLTGGSTYIVSIPKEWASEIGITKGSLVTLTLEPDGTIRVIPSARKPQAVSSAEVVVERGASRGAILREVMSKYLMGYKIIRLNFSRDDPELRRMIKELLVRKLIGAEILHEDSREMTVQVLVNVEDLPISAIISKMRETDKSMLRDPLDLLEKGAQANLDAGEILARDDIIDKLYLYGLRQLNTALKGYTGLEEIGLSRTEEVLSYGMVLKNLERIGDHAVNIAMHLRETPAGIAGLRDLIRYGRRITEVFDSSVETFLKRDKKRANELLDTKMEELREMEKQLTGLYSASDAQLLTSLRAIIGSYRRVADYSSDILEAVIDLQSE